MKRILVLGHRGMLGSDLMKLLASEEVELHGADLPEVDITDRASIARTFDAFGPEIVVNGAAYTDVDGAESHRAEAMRTNGEGAGNVAAAAADCGARILHLSTDFVFDGTKAGPYVETDRPSPINAYGESKLEGEGRVAAACEEHLIVRTSWLYGIAGRNFVTTIRRLAAEKDELTVVDDQQGCPTWTRDLSHAIGELCEVGPRGIVHASGAGACSWYEFAIEIVRLSGLKTPVKPIKTHTLPRPAARPANSVLDTSRLTELTGFRFPHWRESLREFLARLD
jgi:dTDP-4-dehydrorhamnose reductase